MAFDYYFMVWCMFYTSTMPVCCVFWCSIFTLTLVYIRHAKNASWWHIKHPKPLLYNVDWFWVPSLAITLYLLYVIGVPPNQFSACHVQLLSVLCWSPPTKSTRPNTIRSSSLIHPPAIRVLFDDQQTIALVYCCVIIVGWNNQIPNCNIHWRGNNLRTTSMA